LTRHLTSPWTGTSCWQASLFFGAPLLLAFVLLVLLPAVLLARARGTDAGDDLATGDERKRRRRRLKLFGVPPNRALAAYKRDVRFRVHPCLSCFGV
jgi:hypothetical protein